MEQRPARRPKRHAKRRHSQTSEQDVKGLPCEGVLELHPSGYGFLRRVDRNLTRCPTDVFVPESVIQRLRLREGAMIRGEARSGRGPGPRLCVVERIDGELPADAAERIPFEARTATNPRHWLRLEHPEQSVAMRVVDLLCPIGLGQRALIASPPRAGKTTLLKQIGRSISRNAPQVQLKALLVDERPEEVTDMRNEIDGDVFASNLDEDPTNHARLARLVMQHCQRLAEAGEHVVLLVDSLTRLARACNKLPSMTGAIGAGGLNIHALDAPKKLFASARAFAEGGSLTIIATVLIETDNRMDEVIHREFKGTGNSDLVLSQELADRRIWPAIDIAQSGTRRVELLQDERTLDAVTALRNSLLSLPRREAMRELTQKLASLGSNENLIALISEASTKRETIRSASGY